MVTARLLLGRDGEEGQIRYTDDAQGRSEGGRVMLTMGTGFMLWCIYLDVTAEPLHSIHQNQKFLQNPEIFP